MSPTCRSVLTVLFEVALGRYTLGLSWERIVEDYDATGGGHLGFGLWFMAVAHTLAAKLRRSAQPTVRGE